MRAFGWLDKVTIDRGEADQIRAWAAAVLEGESLRSLAAAADRDQLPTVSGSGRWASITIKRTLLSPRNVGTILDPDTVHRLQKLLQDPGRAKFTSTTPSPPSWLLRLAVCGMCDEPLWMQRFSGRATDLKCTAATCGRVAIRQTHLEGDAETRIVARLSDGRWRRALATATELPADHWERQIADARSRIVTLAEQFGGGDTIDHQALHAGVAAARTVITDATHRLTTTTELADLPDPDTVAGWWELLPADRRATIATVMIDRIVVQPRSSGPDRLRYHWLG